MPLVSGIGGLVSVPQGAVRSNGVPPASFKGDLGQQCFDVSANPPIEYIYNGVTWVAAGANPATTVLYGSVLLTDNSEPVATKVYVDAQIAGVVAGAIPVAQTSVNGIGSLATDAQAVAGTATVPGVTALFVQPSNLAAVLAAPSAIGGTTPAAASFTTLAASGLASLSGSATITTGATALNLASDASTGAVNIGTGAGARVITIGNVTGATAVAVNTGTGHFTVTTTTSGDIILNSADTVLIDSAGVLELNSSAGVIGIGNDAVAQNINVGTGAAARIITLGNSSGATSVVLNAGSGNIDIGQNAVAHTIRIGNSTGATGIQQVVGSGNFSLDGVAGSTYAIGASTTTGTITIGGTAQTSGAITLGSSSGTSTVIIQGGAGASTTLIGGGTGAANITSINNGATAQNSTINLMAGAMTAGTHAVNVLSGNSSGGTETLNLCTGTGAYAINIGTGATGVKTIAIGGTAANVITIGNLQTTGSIALGNALTSGTLTLGGTAGTGTITVGQATNATGQSVNINSGASIAGTNIVNVLAGATPAASQTFNLMTGVGSAGTYAVNILTGASTGTTQTVAIGTGSARTDITLGGTGANVFAINNTTTAGTVAIGNAMTTGTIALGGASQTGLITIGKSTLGQTVGINNADSNTVANIVSILNGATPGANNTLNIMNGAGTAGTQTFNLLASGATRAGAVNIATGIAAHAVTIGQVTTTIAINGPTTHTLASGTAVGVTVNTASGTGVGVSVTSSGVTVPDLLSNVGGLKVTPTDVAAGASPLTANNRHFKVVFNTVSIAASADQALVVQNSTITGVNTDIMYSWSGTTTGSAVSLKSVVNAAGQSTLTFTNGAGATTTTSNITVVGWIMN